MLIDIAIDLFKMIRTIRIVLMMFFCFNMEFITGEMKMETILVLMLHDRLPFLKKMNPIN